MKFRDFKKVWIGSLGVAISLGALSFAYDDGEEAEVGLNGLLSTYAPEGLTEDNFKTLSEEVDESWKEWTLETGRTIRDFYEDEHATIEEQRAAIQSVRVKLRTMKTALKDSRYKSIHDEISPLYSNLSAKIDLYDAVLDTLTLDPKQGAQQRVDTAFVSLKNAVSSLKADMANVNGGDQWLDWIGAERLANLDPNDTYTIEAVNAAAEKLDGREDHSDEIKAFLSRDTFLVLEDRLARVRLTTTVADSDKSGVLRDLLSELLLTVEEYEDDPSGAQEKELRKLFEQVRAISPDGGHRIASAMQAHFLNYNLRIFVSEGLLNRFIAESRQDSSWINECIMEARVTGYQCTNSNVSVDVQPSANNALFTLNLSGQVTANTQGSTHQATIQTRGYHTFNGSKPIRFDGYDFAPQTANVGVNANNQTVGATTKFSWIPILGRIANNIAYNEAVSRTPQANAIAANKIRSQVQESLNTEVDQKFQEASLELQANRYGPLREYGMFPDTMLVSSTSEEIQLRSRLMIDGEIGGSRPAPNLNIPTNGLAVQVHQSLLTNGADRLDLHGKTMTDSELREYMEERFTKILGREIEIPGAASEDGLPAPETTFAFDDQDPIRFIIKDGQLEIRLRTGLKREGADDIPVQIISVPYDISLENGKIQMVRGNVGVKPIERPPSIAEQVARANVMRQNIQKNLGDQEMDATFAVEQQGKTLTLSVTAITAEEGWLNVTLQ